MDLSQLPPNLVDLLAYAKLSSYADIATLSLVALGTAGALSRGKLWDKADPYNHKWFERPQEVLGQVRSATAETRKIQEKLEQSVSASMPGTNEYTKLTANRTNKQSFSGVHNPAQPKNLLIGLRESVVYASTWM
jgi:hypothetical protein